MTSNVPALFGRQQFSYSKDGMYPRSNMSGRSKGAIARACAALLLTFALLQGLEVFHGAEVFGSASRPSACSMSCCVARLHHQAGSCHAKLSADLRKPVSASESGKTHGHPAGTHEHTPEAHTDRAATPERSHEPDGDEQTRTSGDVTPTMPAVTTGVLSSRCPPDCHSRACNSARQTRPLDSSTAAHALRPRPPSGARHSHLTHSSPIHSNVLLTQSSPRAPPTLF